MNWKKLCVLLLVILIGIPLVLLAQSDQTGGLPRVSLWVMNSSTGLWDRLRGTAGVGASVASPFSVYSDSTGTSYDVATVVTGAGVGQIIAHVNASGAKSIYFHRMIVTCSAACTFNVAITNTVGTTCTNLTKNNADLGNATASTATANKNCTTAPVVVDNVGMFQLAANTPFTIDLQGYRAASSSNRGIAVNCQNVAGPDYLMAIYWSER